MINVYFYYPSKCLGGAELLFYRLAKELKSGGVVNPIIIDYENGYLHSHLKDTNIDVVCCDSIKKPLIDGGVLILPPSHLLDMDRDVEIGKNLKVLLWSIHPLNIESLLALFPFLHNKKISKRKIIYSLLSYFNFRNFRVLYEKLLEYNALAFMDKANFKSVNFLTASNRAPTYIPIPVDMAVLNHAITDEKDIDKNHVFSVGWVGRLSNFKLKSVEKIYKDLVEITNTHCMRVDFYIVGNGDGFHQTQKICVSTPYLNIKFMGPIPADELDKFIIENIDLMIAMGTSCLDSAKLAKPSLLIDVFPKEIPDIYHYKWLYETEGFTLGEYIENDVATGHRLVDIIVNTDLQEQGSRCQEYVYQHHNISRIADSLISYCRQSLLDSVEFYRLIRMYKSPLVSFMQKIKHIKRERYGKKK